ncbi:MAG: sigma-70 family RNA polymerase sigma factor, partial [Cyanobacteria bacterium J06642_11]
LIRMAEQPELPLLDVLDLALSEILGNGNSYAYSTLATVRRHLYQFRLIHQFEPYEILFEAYIRGKACQRKGEQIYNPHAWLKRTAFNIVREKSRQTQRQAAQNYDDIEYRISAPPEDVLEKIDLRHEIELLYKALRTLSREDDHTAQLLVWRTIEQLSWEQITARLAELGETDIPTQATLRKRVSRAKKRMRHIMHSYGLPTG